MLQSIPSDTLIPLAPQSLPHKPREIHAELVAERPPAVVVLHGPGVTHEEISENKSTSELSSSSRLS